MPSAPPASNTSGNATARNGWVPNAKPAPYRIQ